MLIGGVGGTREDCIWLIRIQCQLHLLRVLGCDEVVIHERDINC